MQNISSESGKMAPVDIALEAANKARITINGRLWPFADPQKLLISVI